MSKEKTPEEIYYEFFRYKTAFGHVFYLIKLFHFLYFQITEEGLYPDEDEYVAKNCMHILSNVINKSLNEVNNKTNSIYEDLSKIQGNDIYA